MTNGGGGSKEDEKEREEGEDEKEREEGEDEKVGGGEIVRKKIGRGRIGRRG